MADLQSVKKGDISHLKGERQLSRWLGKQIIGGSAQDKVLGQNLRGLDPRQKQKILEQQVNINKMRENLAKIKKEKLPEVDQIDALAKQLQQKTYQSRVEQYMSQIQNRVKNQREQMIQLRAVRQNLDQQYRNNKQQIKIQGEQQKKNQSQMKKVRQIQKSPLLNNHKSSVKFQDDKRRFEHQQEQEKRSKIKKKKSKKKHYDSSSEEDSDQDQGYISSYSKKSRSKYKKNKGYQPYPPYQQPPPPPQPYGQSLYPQQSGALYQQNSLNDLLQSQQTLAKNQAESLQQQLLEQQNRHMREQQQMMNKQSSQRQNQQLDYLQKQIQKERKQFSQQIALIKANQQKQMQQKQQYQAPYPPPYPGQNQYQNRNKPYHPQQQQPYPGYHDQSFAQQQPQPAAFYQAPHFTQNDLRAQDLNQQERALFNLQAQQYDALMVLSKLNPQSQLYQYKYKQFLQMSEWRTSAERHLQEQRLSKIKDSYNYQKIEAQREQENNRIMDGAKRDLYFKQLQETSNLGMSAQQFQNQVQNQLMQASTIAGLDRQRAYDSNQGFYILWDFVLGHPPTFQAIKGVFVVKQQYKNDPKYQEINQAYASPGIDPSAKNTIFYQKQLIKGVQPHPRNLLVFQLHGQTPSNRAHYIPIGWSMFDLFSQSNQLKVGAWRIPLYLGETQISFDVREIKTKLLREPSGMTINIRIVQSDQDPLAKLRMIPQNNWRDYKIPPIHATEEQRSMMVHAGGLVSGMVKSPKFDEKYSIQGINILVKQIENFEPKNDVDTFIIFKLLIGTSPVIDDFGVQCQWKSKPIIQKQRLNKNSTNQKLISALGNRSSARLPISSGSGKGRLNAAQGARKVQVFQEISFFKDLYKLVSQSKFQQHVYLILQIWQGQIPIGYGCKRLDKEDNGEIEIGLKQMDVCQPPVQVYQEPIPDHIHRMPQIIKFLIGKPLKRTNLGGNQGDLNNEQVKQADLDFDNIVMGDRENIQHKRYHRFFIQNNTKSVGEEIWRKDDGIVVNISDIRFLPDACAGAKIQISIVNAQAKQISQTVEQVFNDVTTSTVNKAVFGTQSQFHDLQQANALTYLCLKVKYLTMHSKDQYLKQFGMAVFPLFLNSYDKKVCSDQSQKDFYLQQGHYQIGFHPNFDAAMSDYIDNEEDLRLPITSILIRIFKSPKDRETNKVISIENFNEDQWKSIGHNKVLHQYQTGQYSTVYFRPTLGELEGMFKKFDRQAIPLRQNFMRWYEQDGQKSVSLQDQEIAAMLQEQLGEMDQYNGQYFQLGDLLVPYEDHIGLRVSVQKLIAVKQNSFYAVSITLSPPARYYQSPSVYNENEIFLISQIDFESPAKHPQFKDPMLTFRNLKQNIEEEIQQEYLIQGVPFNMFLIAQVYMINPKLDLKRVQPVAFAIANLFQRQQYNQYLDHIYVPNRKMQLPLYKGKFLRSHLSLLQNKASPMDFALESATKAKNQFAFFQGSSSIYLSLIDGHIQNHKYTVSASTDLSKLPKEKKQFNKYLHDMAKSKKTVLCQNLIPRKVDPVKYKQSLALMTKDLAFQRS